MSKVLSYLTSLALIGAVYSTSVVENTTYAALVFVVVWALILMGGICGILFTVILAMVNITVKKIPSGVAEKWTSIDKPKWWLSLPLMLGWLWALSVAGWTVTAVAYLLETTLLLTTSYLMFVRFKQFAGVNEDDLIQHIKDPAVREELCKAREEKRNS